MPRRGPPAPRRSPTSPAPTRSTSASSPSTRACSTWCRRPSRRSSRGRWSSSGTVPIAPRSRHAARAAGLDVRFTGWLDRAATLAHVAHAALLVFPSHGPESLSRVLLEAGGLGVAVAAMDTGGTRDVIVPDETGLLSTSPAGLAADVARLVADPALRGAPRRGGEGPRPRHVRDGRRGRARRRALRRADRREASAVADAAPAARRDPGALRPSAARRGRPGAPRLRSAPSPGAARPRDHADHEAGDDAGSARRRGRRVGAVRRRRRAGLRCAPCRT